MVWLLAGFREASQGFRHGRGFAEEVACVCLQVAIAIHSTSSAHRTSTESTVVAAPSPKCRRGSEDDAKLPPPNR